MHLRRLADTRAGARSRLPWGRRRRGRGSTFRTAKRRGGLDRGAIDPAEYVRRVSRRLTSATSSVPPGTPPRSRSAGSRRARAREWVVRHGLRALVKRGDPAALALLGANPVAPLAGARPAARRTSSRWGRGGFAFALSSGADGGLRAPWLARSAWRAPAGDGRRRCSSWWLRAGTGRQLGGCVSSHARGAIDFGILPGSPPRFVDELHGAGGGGLRRSRTLVPVHLPGADGAELNAWSSPRGCTARRGQADRRDRARLRRAPPAPERRALKLLALSPRGQAALAAARRFHAAYEERLAADLGPTRARALRRDLERLGAVDDLPDGLVARLRPG